MEKKASEDFYKAQKVLKRSLFIILLNCLILAVPFNAFAFESVLEQNYTLNLSFKNAKMEQILDAISEQSGIKIAYSTEELATNKNVSVDIKTSDIKEALSTVLGDGYTFKQIDDYIAIAKKEKDEVQPSIISVADDRPWTVQGQVLENSEPPYPMAGVNISIKGTKLGTVSDQNGYFSLKAKRGDVLVFNFLGFKEYEYVVSRAISNLSVSLKENIETLDEIVITGFSEEKKLNTISSVSSLDIEKNLSTKPITSLSQSLQGGITGLSVTQNSGLPGADAATIKIRGISSLETNNDPLVLVDGIPMDMNQLDPNTIESVTVLKDAAAAAIYGARAANGVIVVKTKRGMPGKVNISYNGYFGLQEATYLPKFIDGAGYMEMVNAANLNIGGNQVYSQEAIDATRNHTDPVNYPDTDWADWLFHTGSLQSHSVAVSGGSNLARFALTVNYLKNNGLVDNTNSDRLNIRANTSVNLLDNLSVNMDFNSYRTNREKPLYSTGGDIFTYVYRTPPTTVIHYPMKEGSDIVYYGNRPEQRNPAAIMERGGTRTNLEDNISINISPRWEIIPKLIIRGQYSYRISSSAQRDEREAYNFFDYNSGAFLQTWGASYTASKDRSSYYFLGGTAEYTFEHNKHRLFAIGGYNQELTNKGDWDRWSMISMFAKANYTFDSRYLLEATVRRDGSSRFGKGNKMGVFPSIGAGWNLHEEAFMKPLKGKINEFKLRASYGLLGNENIGLYKYQTLINSGNGNETVYGNPDITWETVHMLNIGADIRLFRDLSITFDYYDKLTTDMIITPPTSYIGGTSSAPLNSGKVRNRGWEIDFTYGKQLTKNFNFNFHGGLSQNKNKIEDLFGAPYDKGSRIHQIGYALNSYYIYPTNGLLQEDDFTKDAEGNLTPKEGVVIFDGQKPGDIHYLDNNKDGKITTEDRVIRGDEQPKLNYFANITLDYKKWNLEVLFQGVQGVDAYYSEPYSFGLNVGGDGQTPLAVQKDYWTPENPNARYPRMAPNSSYGSNHHTSDYWHFDASYCRVKYIQLGYMFDQMELKKIGISNIRVYANVQNPFTFAKEKLVDPESRGQRGSYPLVKTYSLGLSLNF
ncbi:SusC/RagA family TonB-linked outer membrane protein [Parabacteroides sp. AF17-3]|uniref:TonB-dependent receptor n=1 Tax=Parabacteroides sp. AF17-3 TaxID=2293113 RepID=UPI000EFFDCEB|nr:TonB-dependent receptor [Parabacteroides sp. AF17-3]RKU68344.1 SusC/RagA family TonB-linked outer membrane protein [Parabacteroides sp. AF17-3]